MMDSIGFKWLALQMQISTVQQLAVESRVGTSRRTHVGAIREETYNITACPPSTVAGHLAFGLKHELVNLEFLARLFAVLDPVELEEWIRSEPTGAYARRAGFFYEWLTDRRLNVPDVTAGNYVDALDPEAFIVASKTTNVKRWRVRDNLPGTRRFCPTVRRTDAVRKVERYDCAAALESLEVQYGADVLMRSTVWLSLTSSPS
jgi:hypothetical protein